MKNIVLFFLLLFFSSIYAQTPSYKEKIITGALKSYQENPKKITVGEKTFPVDCSNFVRALYYQASGKDLFEESIQTKIYKKVTQDSFFGGSIGGVILFILFKYRYQVDMKPEAGDIVFFDNTYDKNKNGKWDDPITHLGIVVEVMEDSTVVFIHGGTSKGINRGFLNLKKPSIYQKNGKILNSYLQKTYGWNKGKEKLSGQLVRGFARF
ncbi:MAG TPA: hypothetical protein DHW82_08320 [Spirochaetia bacterium]|nr:MAG: hypothetical protein A2Y41_13950 [Spirochaetes bacterium GWB1_36_13]HCL56996.1 hypothetical protein [Spirochaetia bacterium]